MDIEVRKMENLKKRKTFMYKPKVLTQEDINSGFGKARRKIGKQQPEEPKSKGLNIPNYWKTSGMQKTRQSSLDEYGMEPKKEEEENVWTADEWEEWAIELLNQYQGEKLTPEQMLPEWIIEEWNAL